MIHHNRTVSFRSLIVVAALCVFVAATIGVEAKSLYVISDINSSPTPIQAWSIQPDGTVVFQTETTIPYHGWGAVGLAIDTDSAFLFVTYEQSNVIQIIDATTMQDGGNVTAPNATNLAGIVVDQDKQLIYTVDRHTAHLYVYTWDAVNKVLSLQTDLNLPGVIDAYGIALDESKDWLFVADNASNTIRYFDTASWAEAGNFTVTHPPIGIAVNASAGYVYTGGWYWTEHVSKYDMNTDVETVIYLSNFGISGQIVGLCVDPEKAASPLYTTTYGSDLLCVFDADLTTLEMTSSDIGNPTGLCVPGKEISYNPLNLTKDDGLAYPTEGVEPGNDLTYDFTFDNTLNSFDVTNVTLVDTLPAEVTFVNASGNGSYDSNNHTVTWDIGTIPAGQTGSPEQLVVNVGAGVAPGTTLTNYAEITSTETGSTNVQHLTMVVSGGGPPPEDVFVAYGLHSISIKNSTVTGNVGAKNSMGSGWLHQSFETHVGYGVTLNGDAWGDSLKASKNAAISGDINYNDCYVHPMATVGGAWNTPLTLPVPDPSPTFPSFSPGTTDVIVDKGVTMNLAAGDYGKVELMKSKKKAPAVLILDGGIYNIDQLILGRHTKVECAAACEIRIKNNLSAKVKCSILPAAGSGLTAGDIDIFVEGVDGSDCAAVLGKVTDTQAHVYAPNGTVMIGAYKTNATGIFIGQWVLIKGGTTFVVYEE